MPSEVILPRVDMDMATGKISKWLAAPGAKVTKGQPLFEIETDKAAMEIEAPAAGTLRSLVEAPSQDIPVGSTVAWIFAEGEAEAAMAPAEGPAATKPPTIPQAVGVAPSLTAAAGIEASPDPARARATPLARRLARQSGLDLAALTGSGPRGRIQACDVDRARTAVRADPEAPRTGIAQPAGSPTASVAPTGGPLAIVALRQGHGTPLVLIHGWGADANNWRPFLSGQPQGQPVFGLDLPGHGASPLGAVSCFADMVDLAEATLLGAGLGAIQLVGHSLGGAVAAAVAARGQIEVKSLLLLAPAGLGPSINGAFLRGYLAASSEASLTPWMHQLVADPTVITPAFVRATLKSREGTALTETQRRIAEAVFPDDTQAFSIRQDLARSAVPARIVLGGDDRIVPSAYAAGLPGLVAIHRFPGIGHMPHLEVRDAVAAILREMARP